MISISEEDSQVTRESIGQVINATRPVQVRVDEIHCGPVPSLDFDNLRYRLQRLEPSFAVANDGRALLVRLPHVLQCFTSEDGSVDEDETSATDIQVAHLAAFNVLDDVETTVQTVSAWIETNVYFLIYPYVRQILTTLTGELGLPPVVLDYMHRDEMPYSSFD